MHDRTTHNINQLGFSGLRGFGSRFSVLVGGQVRAPQTQPFHIVKRWHSLKKNGHEADYFDFVFRFDTGFL